MTITGTPIPTGTYYGTVDGVESYVPMLGNFGGATTPTSAQVVAWLEDATAIIDRMLTTAGYVAPVANTSANYAELVGLANLYAAARALQSRGIETATSEAPARWQAMLDEFYARLGIISGSILTGVTLTVTSTGQGKRRLRTFQVTRVDRQVPSGSEYGAIADG